MACEFSANAVQTVPVGGSLIFTESPVPCNRGLVFHRDDSGLFRLANRFFRQNMCVCGCGCRRGTNYEVAFHANIAVPEGETVPVDGELDPSSTMISVPSAAEIFDSAGADIIVSVPWICGCSNVSVRNTSTIPVDVQNANIVFDLA